MFHYNYHGNDYYSSQKKRKNYGYSSNTIDSDGNFTPFGISNLGNTCFMNSALQCLLSLSYFIKDLDKLISTTSNHDLLSAFKDLIHTTHSNEVKQIVARKNHIFYGFGQQDSFEFAITFLETIMDENEKLASKLFQGKSQSIIRCKKCHKDESINQDFLSFVLSIQGSRLVTYVPFSMRKSAIRMFDKPQISEPTRDQYNWSNSRSIKDYILMAKIDNKYVVIDQVSIQYPEIYAFELPKEKVKDGHCLTVIQPKTEDKIPITSPFICEVPLGEIEEDKLASIILERLEEVTKVGRKSDTTIKIKKPQPIIFTKMEDQISSEKCTFSNEFVTVILNKRCFSFSDRKEVNQKGQIDLVHLFKSHSKQNQLDPPSKWTCEFCKKKSRAFQRVKITSIPKIILFLIKRSSDNNYSPDNTAVLLPQRISLDIKSEFDQIVANPTENDKGVVFELRSISQHGGSFGGGHYWAHGKRGNKWYDFNDSSCHQIGVPNEASSSSHMAFYQRVKYDDDDDDEAINEKQPGERESSPDDANEIHEDGTNEVHEDDANEIHEDDANEMHEDDANEVHEDDANEVHEDDANEIHEDDANEMHEDDANEVHEDDANEMHEDDANEVHKGDNQAELENESKPESEDPENDSK